MLGWGWAPRGAAARQARGGTGPLVATPVGVTGPAGPLNGATGRRHGRGATLATSATRATRNLAARLPVVRHGEGLRGAQQRLALPLRHHERAALVRHGELGPRAADRLWRGTGRGRQCVTRVTTSPSWDKGSPRCRRGGPTRGSHLLSGYLTCNRAQVCLPDPAAATEPRLPVVGHGERLGGAEQGEAVPQGGGEGPALVRVGELGRRAADGLWRRRGAPRG